MHHIKCELLSIYQSVDHKNVTGAEIIRVRIREIYIRPLECERNGLAVQVCELIRFIKKSHVHSTPVRAVIMDYLIIGIHDSLLTYQVFENQPVLHFGHSQNSVISAIIFSHLGHDLGHIALLDIIFGLSPLVFSFRKILGIVLYRVIVDVKEIFEVIEPYYVILLCFLSISAKERGENTDYKD